MGWRALGSRPPPWTERSPGSGAAQARCLGRVGAGSQRRTALFSAVRRPIFPVTAGPGGGAGPATLPVYSSPLGLPADARPSPGVPVLTALRSAYHRSLFHAGHRVRARHMLAAVADHAPEGGRVLDAGSGGGSYSFAIARRFPHLQVEGMELDPHKVAECEAKCQAEGRGNLHFLVGDITRIGRHAHYDL